MSDFSPIRIGSRVYLRNAIAGEPGMIMRFESRGRAVIYWPDLPELARETTHSIDSLVVDEAFKVEQLGLAFEEQAA